MSLSEKNVLYTHAHTVIGNTADKLAVFAFKLFGADVSHICSLQLSNSTDEFENKDLIRKETSDADPDASPMLMVNRMDLNDTDRLYRSMKRAGRKYDFIFCGYVGEGESKIRWGEIIKEIKSNQNDVIYMCDPILGDESTMYEVPESVDLFKEHLLPQADIATPNGYELGWLLGRDIVTEDDVFDGINLLHDVGVKIVFVTSTTTGNPEKLSSYVSVLGDKNMCYKIEFDKLPASFLGPGDLTAALFGCWYMIDGDVKNAFEKTLSTMNQIIERTYKHAVAITPAGVKIRQRALDLRVLDDISILRNPTVNLTSRRISIPKRDVH